MTLARRYGSLAALLVLALGVWPAASNGGDPPVARAAATCSDYPNQAAAQRAADTTDADGDGIYCESLPCPCSKAAAGDGGSGGGSNPAGCTRPAGLQRVVFSATKYPNIRRHFRAPLRRGWPLRLVVNRPGADERRDRLLEGVPTRPGFDRDEYPRRSGGGEGRVLSAGSTRAAGRPMCATSRAPRTARTARHLV